MSRKLIKSSCGHSVQDRITNAQDIERTREIQGSILMWSARALLSGVVTLLVSSCALPDFHRVPDEAGGSHAVGGHTATGGRSSGDTKGVNTGGNGGGSAANTGGTPSSGGAVATVAGAHSGGLGLATGGTLSTPGTASSGGASTSGGTPSNFTLTNSLASGGATGGSITTGGASSTPVTTGGGAVGGAVTNGGIASTGGTTETGGIRETGGTSATPIASGGAATGGAPESGGFPATGGAPATGGIPSTGIEFVPPAASTKSCSGLGSICQGESCCTSIAMPGGQYLMGRGTEDCGLVGCQTGTGNEGCPVGSSCWSEELPEHSATVASFALDKYEVTVGRFRNFVNSYNTWHGANPSNPQNGDGLNPNTPSTGWAQSWTADAADLPTDATMLMASLNCSSSHQTWMDSPGKSATEAYPINCVTWHQAFAFCIWDGGRLPTEAEWEYAASGGAQNRLYPWGSAAPNASRANYYDSNSAGSVFTAVGSKLTTGGSGYFGHADLAGSMYEWAFDWYSSTYYGSLSSPATCSNCANTTPSSTRVIRGDSWNYEPSYLRVASRIGTMSTQHIAYLGFRCARSR